MCCVLLCCLSTLPRVFHHGLLLQHKALSLSQQTPYLERTIDTTTRAPWNLKRSLSTPLKIGSQLYYQTDRQRAYLHCISSEGLQIRLGVLKEVLTRGPCACTVHFRGSTQSDRNPPKNTSWLRVLISPISLSLSLHCPKA